MNAKLLAETIFREGVESVMPHKMIRCQVLVQDEILSIGGSQIDLKTLTNIYVIGAGKASANMAKEIENILGDRIKAGHVVVKYGHGCVLQYIEVSEAGHPVPDDNGYAATQKILDIANQATENDLVICLLSGGGSALLADFPEGSTIDDVITLNEILLKSGADIKEINAVRKHLSKVKGGQLAKSAYPARVISLILSDVIGDPLDAIASGPTVPDSTTFSDAMVVLEKYNLPEETPKFLVEYLKNGSEGCYAETPKIGDVVFNNTHNFIIGNNEMALEACRQKAIEEGLNPFIITSNLEGDTAEAAREIIDSALSFQNDKKIKKPCCLLFGGETTIKVCGTGTGGRNQHLALYASLFLRSEKGITLLSAGTDGNDGPTYAAGAVVDTDTYKEALQKGLDIENYLHDFDSFHFFEKAGGHIVTGPTMTNVMDIVIVIIE
jgi:glycerate 2-kinase